MKNTFVGILLAVFLSGCAQFSSKEATVGCQAADTVTTIIALKSGASEANPLLAPLIASVGYGGLIVVKALVTWLLLEVREEAPEVVGGVNAATCAVAARNVLFW